MEYENASNSHLTMTHLLLGIDRFKTVMITEPLSRLTRDNTVSSPQDIAESLRKKFVVEITLDCHEPPRDC
jgi:hypothetical protein